MGYIGIDSVRAEVIWRESNITLLQMIGDIFANALERKRAETEAEILRKNIEAQSWLTRGQAQLAEKMRGEQTIEMLANNITSYLCRYLDAQTGALFIVSGEKLKLTGRYAYVEYTGQKDEFGFGENLIGEAAKANRIIRMDDIPADAPLVSSALGDAIPRQVLIAPIEAERQVVGVVELATLTQFSTQSEIFLNHVSENIAIALRTAQTRVQVNDLLAQSQRQAEELQAQEEELRASNEELQSQADNIRGAMRDK
jgi:GAF domain-containing protein